MESQVKDNSASIKSLVDSLTKNIDRMAVKVKKVDSRVTTLEKESAALCERVEGYGHI